MSKENKSSVIYPFIIHSAVTLPAPPALAIPMLLNPQQAKSLSTSEVSPKRYCVSGVNDSGPEKNFLIPALLSNGNL